MIILKVRNVKPREFQNVPRNLAANKRQNRDSNLGCLSKSLHSPALGIEALVQPRRELSRVPGARGGTLTCPVGRDGSQFHSQRVAHVSVVFQRVPVTPGAVREPLPTQHRAIGQIQPEVLPQVTPGTLPTTGEPSRSS